MLLAMTTDFSERFGSSGGLTVCPICDIVVTKRGLEGHIRVHQERSAILREVFRQVWEKRLARLAEEEGEIA